MRTWVPVLGLVICGCSFRPGASGRDGGPDVAVDVPPIDAIDSAMPDSIPGDWWDSAWHHRRELTIDNATITQDLDGFPILVTLSPGTFDYNLANATGTDIRFVAADGTVLKYEIDTYVTTGASWIWVRVPLIPAVPNPDPTLWMYYGNSAASATNPTAAATWASNVSVHHLASGTFADAAGNGHTGISLSVGATPADVAGKFGRARHFDGNDEIQLAAENGYDFTTAMSLSMWVRVTTFDVDWQCMVCKGDTAWRVHRGLATNHADFGTTNASDSNTQNLDSGGDVDGNAWHHVAVVFGTATKQIFVDGAPDGSVTYNDTIKTNDLPVGLGQNDEQAGRGFKGDIDELRVTGIERTPLWIATEYRSETSTTFLTLGADEAIP